MIDHIYIHSPNTARTPHPHEFLWATYKPINLEIQEVTIVLPVIEWKSHNNETYIESNIWFDTSWIEDTPTSSYYLSYCTVWFFYPLLLACFSIRLLCYAAPTMPIAHYAFSQSININKV